MIKEEGIRVLKEESEALANQIDLIGDEFESAVKEISSAQQIAIMGVGKSGLVGKKISATFSSVGIPSVFLHPVDALHGDLGILTEDDLCILISKSGTTEELIKIIPYIKERCKTSSITANRESYLAKNTDYSLLILDTKEACPLELAPTTSTTLTIALGDAIAAAVMVYKGFDSKSFAKNHPLGQLGRNLTITVKDIMHKSHDLPLVNVGTTFKDGLIEMTDKALGCLCIHNNNKLVGIITDGDTRRALNKFDDIINLKVEDVMTSDPISIKKDTLLGEALSVMENRKSQINVLPVVNEDDECIGVVRVHDIIKSEL